MNSTNEQCLFYAFVDKKFVNIMTKQLPIQTRLNSVETGNSSSEIPQQTMNGHITTWLAILLQVTWLIVDQSDRSWSDAKMTHIVSASHCCTAESSYWLYTTVNQCITWRSRPHHTSAPSQCAVCSSHEQCAK